MLPVSEMIDQCVLMAATQVSFDFALLFIDASANKGSASAVSVSIVHIKKSSEEKNYDMYIFSEVLDALRASKGFSFGWPP